MKRSGGRGKYPVRVRELFLEALKGTGMVKQACEIAGIARQTPYEWCQKSVEFAEAMDNARATGEKVLLDEVKQEVRRRGLEGVEEPLSYQGKLTGDTVRKWSDLLLMFYGKYLDPRFRDNFPAASTRMGDVNLQVNVFTGNRPQVQPHEKPAAEPSSEVIDLGPGQGDS